MIEIDNLSIAYGKKQILDGLSLSAERGECIGIVGPNGCGKSTLLSTMAGVLRPKTGSINYYGKDALANRKVFAKMVGYVPQENPLLPELSVYDNLRLWYPNKKELEGELEEGFLQVLGISEFIKMSVSKLSGGMKKRVSIGIAMAGMPPILILDEPSAALDLVCKEDIKRYLQIYLERKGTVIITTHEESELSLCDSLYVMKDGKLHQIDKTLRGELLTARF
ncbi:MAG: ATP-binding cassette domain-containing protein [Lachnospiraceae bacterium]|nr:ATP-binding cassette domain-containing protein [Lachnospiraceae bacterium]